MKQNIELHDGDTIFVPRAESVYVFGQVKNPGAYAIQKDTTVLQALSLAGGVTENGAMNRIKIVRIVNGEKKELKVKLTDLVQPGDTIIVPEKYLLMSDPKAFDHVRSADAGFARRTRSPSRACGASSPSGARAVPRRPAARRRARRRRTCTCSTTSRCSTSAAGRRSRRSCSSSAP